MISGVPSSGGSGCASGSEGGVGTPEPTTDSASGRVVAVGVGSTGFTVGCIVLTASRRSSRVGSGVRVATTATAYEGAVVSEPQATAVSMINATRAPDSCALFSSIIGFIEMMLCKPTWSAPVPFPERLCTHQCALAHTSPCDQCARSFRQVDPVRRRFPRCTHPAWS